MFSNIEDIISYDVTTNQYGILNKECLQIINKNSSNFKMIDFDVCNKGYSICYKKNLFISFC